jgi:dihydrofolate synthase/folylpolyglutamate synthase
LARFHERICLAGRLIDEPDLSQILDECLAANGPDEITYFEATTAAAFLAFSRVQADYTLLEVGLGGRLDATNVVSAPALTIITPVDLDHQQFLGDTIGDIAGEKAGIIKRGVPCIVGPQHAAALDVIEAQAASRGAPIYAYGQHWHIATEHGRLVFQDETGLLDLPLPNLIGAHQVQNAGVALAALRVLGQTDAAFEAAVTRAHWPARLQYLRHGPLVDAAPQADLILDGGHNPHAARAISATLRDLPARPTYMICGMLNTKDATGFFAPFAGQIEQVFAVTIPGQDATLPAQDTADYAARAGHRVAISTSVQHALDHILTIAPQARVLICGSLYLAGEVLKENG